MSELEAEAFAVASSAGTAATTRANPLRTILPSNGGGPTIARIRSPPPSRRSAASEREAARARRRGR
jgi:hypothetical protein